MLLPLSYGVVVIPAETVQHLLQTWLLLLPGDGGLCVGEGGDELPYSGYISKGHGMNWRNTFWPKEGLLAVFVVSRVHNPPGGYNFVI